MINYRIKVLAKNYLNNKLNNKFILNLYKIEFFF